MALPDRLLVALLAASILLLGFVVFFHRVF